MMRSVSSQASRWWMTTFKPHSAASSSCCRKSVSCAALYACSLIVLRQVMVIQPRLADGHHARMPRQLPQGVQIALRRLLHGGRVNADRCEDIRVLFRQGDRAAAALQRSADGNDPGHARRLRALQHAGEILLEIRVIQVGVRLDQHENKGRPGAGRNLPPALTIAPPNWPR